ncbi:MAG: cytochrome c3 family protein [Pirellulales bacterium]|nr:cytochrome c3 family protein [Pirellulales bacterium]
MTSDKLLFPAWLNRVWPLVGLFVLGAPVYGVVLLYLGGSPGTTDVGYEPVQPVPFSHATHAGKIGMDCRYCHTTVEKAAFAAVPPTSVCMNCHRTIGPDLKDLEPIRRSDETGDPVHWIRVHDLPDYVYFDHSAHVTRGVSCVSCHGRIDRMERVYQAETLSMSWCLDCHRDAAPHIRPKEQMTNLRWNLAEDPEILEADARALGERLMRELGIESSVDCSTCHR